MSESIEQLKEQLSKIQEEKKKLEEELNHLKSEKSPTSSLEWDLSHRVSIESIISRPDNGRSLIGRPIAVAGWVKTVRSAAKGTVSFIKLNDGSCWDSLQVVVDKGTPGFEKIEDHSITLASSVFVVGTLVESKGSEQAVELRSKNIKLMGPSDAAKYPLAKKQHTLEFLREILHFRPRSQIITAITRVRNALAFATHLYFQNQGYLYINTPLITCSDCEGAGEMFQVTTLFSGAKDKHNDIPKTKEGTVDYTSDFFKKPAFLTVSGQLNAEIYACALGSVYTFGPTFRAEYSFTSRHLAEFWMIEPEIAFADIIENMNIAEGYVRFVLNYALEHCAEEMLFLEQTENELLAERQKVADEEAKKVADEEKKKAIEEKKKIAEEKKKAAEEAKKAAGETKKEGEETKKEEEVKKEETKKEGEETKKEEEVKKEGGEAKKEGQETKKEGEEAKKEGGEAKKGNQQQQQKKGKQQQQQQKKAPTKDVKGFQLKPLRERISHVANSSFARITYSEAIDLLLASDKTFENPVSWGIDLSSEHERWLAEEKFQKPVIVRNYPKGIKAFYMRLNEDEKTVAAMDVLVPGIGELIGGSQREERLDVLESRIKEANLDTNAYEWYLDLRKYGSVVHSGFGLGFERLVCYATGVENIREAIPFPRWPGHAEY